MKKVFLFVLICVLSVAAYSYGYDPDSSTDIGTENPPEGIGTDIGTESPSSGSPGGVSSGESQGRILDLGEPTSAESSEMDRDRESSAMNDSAEPLTMEDMAERTTDDQREFD